MRIFLIRHPPPEISPRFCYGHMDVGLSSNSLQQLNDLASHLREQLPATVSIHSSPLRRCRLLAEALHAKPIYDDRLKEMHFGEWEGRLWSDVPREQLDQWANDPLRYVIPGGESVEQMQQRISSFMHDHRHIESLTLVTHAGVMKVLTGLAQQRADTEWMKLHFDYGSVAILDWNSNASAFTE